MADTLFPKGAQKMLTAGINFSTDTIKAVYLSSGYTYDATDEFLADVGATTVGTAWTLGSKTVTGGVFDAADTAPATFASGDTLKAVLIYKDTGSSATSPLIAYFDSVTGLPMATNGGEISIPWSNSGYGIFSLL